MEESEVKSSPDQCDIIHCHRCQAETLFDLSNYHHDHGYICEGCAKELDNLEEYWDWDNPMEDGFYHD